MCKPGNTSLALHSLRYQAIYNLYNSPKAYNYQGWNLHGLHKKTEKDDRMYPRHRKKEKIGSKHT